jgi:hypothetical protein
VRVSKFKLCEKNSLRGFFDVALPSGMVVCGCTLHETNGRHWVGLPSKPYPSDDGAQAWAKIVDFVDKETHSRFQQQVTPLALLAFESASKAVVAPVFTTKDRLADILDDDEPF